MIYILTIWLFLGPGNVVFVKAVPTEAMEVCQAAGSELMDSALKAGKVQIEGKEYDVRDAGFTCTPVQEGQSA